MANLVAAGAFRFVHRGVGDFDEAFDVLPVEFWMFGRRWDAATARAGCPAPGWGGNREAHRLGGLKCFPSPVVLGDEEFPPAASGDPLFSTADAPQGVGDSHQDAIPGGV